jgi:hypothetical protein
VRTVFNANELDSAPDPPGSLLAVLASLEPLDNDFPPIPELAVDPVEL